MQSALSLHDRLLRTAIEAAVDSQRALADADWAMLGDAAPLRSRMGLHTVEADERAGSLCEYCHTSELYQYVPFTVDHVLPIGRGGGEQSAERTAIIGVRIPTGRHPSARLCWPGLKKRHL